MDYICEPMNFIKTFEELEIGQYLVFFPDTQRVFIKYSKDEVYDPKEALIYNVVVTSPVIPVYQTNSVLMTTNKEMVK